jgi:hypothetical protein
MKNKRKNKNLDNREKITNLIIVRINSNIIGEIIIIEKITELK